MKSLQGREISSVRTVANYEERLIRTAVALKEANQGGLRDMTRASAISHLELRAGEVGQKTLDMERQAIQAMMQHVTARLGAAERLPVIKSDYAQILTSRAYTPEQVTLIANAQNERNSLSTEIAHSAGLRAHELLALAKAEDRAADSRPSLDSKWSVRDGQLYTVQGKGGLVREILIPNALAERLEARLLEAPLQVADRGVNYSQSYDIAGGQRWSNSFSAAANRVLGWSEGAHGLRHSYAQERMQELQSIGLGYGKSLETVSQEMGHFRPEITEVYLR